MLMHVAEICALIGANKNRALICSDAILHRTAGRNEGILAHIFRACAYIMASLSYTSCKDVRKDNRTCTIE